jgi:hypothetical protein
MIEPAVNAPEPKRTPAIYWLSTDSTILPQTVFTEVSRGCGFQQPSVEVNG